MLYNSPINLNSLNLSEEDKLLTLGVLKKFLEVSTSEGDTLTNMLELEEFIKTLPQAMDTIKIKEYVADGVVVREATALKGTIVSGKTHLKTEVGFLSKGCMVTLTNYGIEFLTAPSTVVYPANIKRISYCISDVVWSNIHSTSDIPMNDTQLLGD